jgi:hypothetical protein
MKKVAGFHSFDLTFFFKAARGELWRRGFGIKPSQNDVCATFGALEYCRWIGEWIDLSRGGSIELRMAGGAKSTRRSIIDLFMANFVHVIL